VTENATPLTSEEEEESFEEGMYRQLFLLVNRLPDRLYMCKAQISAIQYFVCKNLRQSAC